MKKNGGKSLQVVLGLLILIGLIVAGVFILNYLVIYIMKAVKWLSNLTEKIDAVIIVALLTASFTIISMIVSKIIEQRQATKRYLYSKREEPYTDFVEVVYKLRDMSNKTDGYTESEMIRDLVKISKGLTLWGSNKVIKKWIKFRTNSVDKKITPSENLLFLEDIIFDIRRDMGHRRGLLQKGDMLKFFINDVDEELLKPKIKKT